MKQALNNITFNIHNRHTMNNCNYYTGCKQSKHLFHCNELTDVETVKLYFQRVNCDKTYIVSTIYKETHTNTCRLLVFKTILFNNSLNQCIIFYLQRYNDFFNKF